MTWDPHHPNVPSPAEIKQLIRAELESRDTKIAALEREVDRWKTASTVLKWGVVTTMAVLSAGVTVWDWSKEHIRF